RIDSLQAALNALEPQPAGRRPRQTVTDEAEVQRLRERIAQLEGERQAALVRAEIAMALPLVQAAAGKKTSLAKLTPPQVEVGRAGLSASTAPAMSFQLFAAQTLPAGSTTTSVSIWILPLWKTWMTSPVFVSVGWPCGSAPAISTTPRPM